MGEDGTGVDGAHEEDATDLDSSGPPALLVWTLAAFHAAFLVALVVAAVYLAGLANDGLAALETWIGVLAYLYLWGVTWWTNRRMLDAVGSGLLTGSTRTTDVFVEAMKWGGVAGFLAFLPALAVGIALFVGAGGVEALPFVVVGAAIGSALSVGVGVLVGGVFALVDHLLLRAARAWLPAGPGPGRTEPVDAGPSEP